jgi:hypothetical protein
MGQAGAALSPAAGQDFLAGAASHTFHKAVLA